MRETKKKRDRIEKRKSKSQKDETCSIDNKCTRLKQKHKKKTRKSGLNAFVQKLLNDGQNLLQTEKS